MISRMARNPERTASWSSAMRVSVTSRHPFFPTAGLSALSLFLAYGISAGIGETLTFSEARARCRAAPTGGVARAHFRVFYRLLGRALSAIVCPGALGESAITSAFSRATMKIAAIWLIVAAFLLAATSVQKSADAQWYDTSKRGDLWGP